MCTIFTQTALSCGLVSGTAKEKGWALSGSSHTEVSNGCRGESSQMGTGVGGAGKVMGLDVLRAAGDDVCA